MSRSIIIVVAVLAIIALAALAFAVFRTPEEASAPITAATLTIETSQPVVAATEPATAAPEPTVAPAATEPAADPTATLAEEATAVPEATATTAPAAVAAPAIFEIIQAESEARFIIDEVLRGSPVTVVGVTDQVAGQIAIDPASPAATQLGEVRVNARTLATDNDFRNRAIKNQILDTNTYEFVSFQPTEMVDLPETATVGQPFTFQVVGDLTIRDVTQQVTFEVTVTPVSGSRIEGLATTTFPYRDFGLAIPDAPSVDTVADDVTLELEFVAVAE
ncbi:MAG TPA: YceI family protein [Anaerolineae bacterium]|nr:YceI family protein [Anaerolineae bacterium]